MTDVLYTPASHEEGIRSGGKWIRRFRITRANSIIWDGSKWVSRRTVSDDTLRSLKEGITYFRGGCTYLISQELATQLTAAVGGNIEIPKTPRGFGTGSYGTGAYGEGTPSHLVRSGFGLGLFGYGPYGG